MNHVEAVRSRLHAMRALHHVAASCLTFSCAPNDVLGTVRYTRATLARHEAWRAMAKDGWSPEQIAEAFGVSPRTVEVGIDEAGRAA